MSSEFSPLVVSMGDPAGIGPDIILKAWAENGANLPTFYVLGSTEILSKRAKRLGIDIEFSNVPDDRKLGDGLNVFDLESDAAGEPGTASADDARLTIHAIETGVKDVVSGRASGLVTCPINKKALYDIGFKHPGHTEFLADLAQADEGSKILPVMMLAGPELRTVPVTIHIPLSDVSTVLDEDLIVKTARIVASDLSSRFGIDTPRLALAGLNPHAGENGALGKEDSAIIEPAIKKLQSIGINAVGPLPADTMFHASAREKYDVALCMYHDQALIPAKMLGFDDAVNVTLGLPFIRTSPDHGTAYDIAGTGKANPSSFIAALNMAAEMAARSS